MLRSITWPQFVQWMEYAEAEPFGDRRQDWHAASLCATMMNQTAMLMRSETRFNVRDFLLDFDGEEKPTPAPEKSWQEMRMIAQMLAAASNSKKRR